MALQEVDLFKRKQTSLWNSSEERELGGGGK